MIEAFGDFWDYTAAVKCITTNGDVNRRGLAVMGRGIALQATQHIPDVAALLGVLLEKHGNHVNSLGTFDGQAYLSFPVKHHWSEKANMRLICQSAYELRDLVRRDFPMGHVLLPRPGCGNGGLEWDDVRELIGPILHSKRFVIIDREPDA